MSKQNSESVPQQMRPVYDEITHLTDAVCRDHIDEEYAQLCHKLAAALARKRPSPLARGKPEIWACAIVYALGTVNFLFDKTQTPYLRADELCGLFGVRQSSAANKAKQIRDMFDMGQADPRWYRPSRMNDNPIAWMVMVNGFIVDVRTLPREVQEEAYHKGLIPYLPGQRE
jgi:hypothetical protein